MPCPGLLRALSRLLKPRAGQVLLDGRDIHALPAKEVVTAELIDDVFGLPCRIIDDPETGTPLVIPRSSIVRLT